MDDLQTLSSAANTRRTPARIMRRRPGRRPLSRTADYRLGLAPGAPWQARLAGLVPEPMRAKRIASAILEFVSAKWPAARTIPELGQLKRSIFTFPDLGRIKRSVCRFLGIGQTRRTLSFFPDPDQSNLAAPAVPEYARTRRATSVRHGFGEPGQRL